MQFSLANLVRVGVVCLLLTATASAVPLGPLPGDSNAMAGWADSFSIVGIGGGTSYDAIMEYAVYAPGKFSSSTALSTLVPPSSPTDPSAGLDYVYAYQLFNKVASPSSLNTLSVGLYAGGVPAAYTNANISNYTNTSILGIKPAGNQFISSLGVKTQSKFTFSTNPTFDGLVDPGEHSDIMFFTSPFPPVYHVSTVSAGVPFLNFDLPSPAPEPATLVLAVCGAVCLLGARCFRRQSA